MKKTTKTHNKGIYAGIGITLAFLLVFAVSYGASAEFSFIERLLALTSDKYAAQLAAKTDVGELAETFGAFPGGDIYNRVNMHAGYQSGGDRYSTTSSAATYTLVANEALKGDITYVEWLPNLPLTITTMATTSMGWLGTQTGDERSFWFYNATTSATTGTITIAAGTGVDLQMNEDTADLGIEGLDLTKLTFIRKANTDVFLIMTEYIEAD